MGLPNLSIFSGSMATLSLAVGATAPDGLETLPLSLALILQGHWFSQLVEFDGMTKDCVHVFWNVYIIS